MVRQTVVSGSEATTFELLLHGTLVAERTLDRERQEDRLVLEDAQRAVNRALREHARTFDERILVSPGPTMMSRDRYAETQEMIRAFAGVVWADLRLEHMRVR